MFPLSVLKIIAFGSGTECVSEQICTENPPILKFLLYSNNFRFRLLAL